MTPAERKALAFFALLAALGAAARAAGLGDPPPPDLPGGTVGDERAALDRQLAAVDSARAARRPGRSPARARRPRPRARASPDSTAPVAASGTASVAASVASAPARPSSARPPTLGPPPPVDVDRADSAALEALPGVGPALARRIVRDRQARGPFGSIAGLSRVPGVGPRLEARLAPLVTFSAR